MSDTDHTEQPGGPAKRPATPRFTVREERPPRRPPQPLRNTRDPFEDLSIGTRSVTRPAVAVHERARRPAIVRASVADQEPEPRPSPLAESTADVEQAHMFVEPPAARRPAYPPPPAYGPRPRLLDALPSGPWLAALISGICLAILYTFWMQPPQTRFSTFPGGRQAPRAVEVNPADFPQLATPPGENTVVGPPTITAEQIDAILAEYGSPAAGTGRVWLELGLRYKIDPAYALAFFIHESGAGTNPAWAGIKPDGSTTHNVGNIICAGYPTCFNRFRDYANWEAGIEDWYKLIAVEYIGGRGTHTVEQIIPIYAPSVENNVPAYIDAVNRLVQSWRAAGVRR
ncbi:MAG TPA: hypothetical protein VNL77_11800 [Roseiflexaceae bacterium]|nr:hypothetical protein [Roseiflexaceae bacterium]